MSRRTILLLATIALLSSSTRFWAELPSPAINDVEQKKAALAKFNTLMGGWRGVGQVKRYSNQGAWSEKADWVWAFTKGEPTIRYKTEKGQLFDGGALHWDVRSQHYRFDMQLSDGGERSYVGKLAERKLVATAKTDEAGDLHRVTLTLLTPKRTLLLAEKQAAGRKRFSRIAEIGYTRKGTSLAKETLGGPECVVTGGLGTIAIEYKQMTYYVCCTGCRQAFNDDPEGTLEDYRARKRKTQASK